MRLSLYQIVGLRAQIEALKHLDPQPPLWLAMRLTRNLRLLEGVLRDWDQAHEQLFERYGKPADNGWRIDPEDTAAVQAYSTEVREALQATVDLDLHPVTAAELQKAQQTRADFEVPLHLLVDLSFLFDLESELPHDPTPDV